MATSVEAPPDGKNQTDNENPSSSPVFGIFPFPLPGPLFSPSIPSDFVDSICGGVVWAPVVTPCEHLFCANCLNRWCAGKSSVICPNCRFEFPPSAVFPLRVKNPLAFRVLGGALVDCPGQITRNCQWTGEYSNLESHLKHRCTSISSENSSFSPTILSAFAEENPGEPMNAEALRKLTNELEVEKSKRRALTAEVAELRKAVEEIQLKQKIYEKKKGENSHDRKSSGGNFPRTFPLSVSSSLLSFVSRLPPPSLLSVSSSFFSRLSVSDRLDVRDSKGKWLAGVIRNIRTPSSFLVHYELWASTWDEWMDFFEDSHRVAPIGTFSSPDCAVVCQFAPHQIVAVYYSCPRPRGWAIGIVWKVDGPQISVKYAIGENLYQRWFHAGTKEIQPAPQEENSRENRPSQAVETSAAPAPLSHPSSSSLSTLASIPVSSSALSFLHSFPHRRGG